MRLKRLEIQGFKSFARPVKLEFGAGITAIVGPNGSGKSNISDAVRWVLGEQSARSLRGQRMEDIIFAGSDGKRPLGMAEVQLTLDNTEGFLPLEYGEVTVTRRVYRSGESEFFINKQNCRLRDIHDLFTDTGLGREGYAIIGQGQIEAVLSVRSEDRRVLLEETAGIIKYRQRKEQALSKLEETSVDLLRVSDILHELEGQLDGLQKQAEKARLYLDLAEKLKEVELDYYNLLWVKIESEAKKVAASQEEAKSAYEKWAKLCSQLEKEKGDLESLAQALEHGIEQTQQELFHCVELFNEGEHTIQLYQDRLRNHKERCKQLVNIQLRSEDELILLTEQEQALQVKYAEQLALIKKQEEQINASRELVNNITQTQKEKASALDKLKNDFFDFVRELADKRNAHRAYEERKQNLLNQVTGNQGEIKETAARLEVLASQLSASSLEQTELFEQLKTLENDLKAKQAELQEVQLAVGKFEEKERNLAAQSAQLAARIRTLQELEEGYEGYAFGVRRIMQNPQLSSLVLGTVADVITVPSGLETAFEVALGAALQNVITADEKAAKQLISWLQQNQAGRVTFLPLSSVRGGELSQRDRAQLVLPGVLGTGLDLLQFPAQFRPVLASLLGRVVITEDLDCALTLKERLQRFSRLVTKDGSVVYPSGAMTGGSLNNRTSGLLARKSELETLAVKLDQTKQQQVEQKAATSDLAKKVESLKETINSLQEKRVEIQLELQAIQQNISQTEKEQVALEKAKSRLSERFLELEQIRQTLDAEQEAAASQVDTLEDQEQVLRKQIKAEEQLLADLAAKQAEASELQVQEQIKFAELKGVLENYQLQLHTILERKDAGERAKAESVEEQQVLLEEKAEFSAKIEQTQAANAERKIKKEELRQSLTEKREERETAQKKAAEVSQELAIAQKEQVQKERALYQSEVQLERFQREQERILENLQERELEIQAILGRKVERDEAHLKRSIDKLKRQIRDLGIVNPAAAQEYERVVERCEFLRTQLTDLNEARDSLQDVINEMDKLCRTKLQDAFNRVQAEFQVIFSQLFNGGKANLVLTDPESILTTGIEVMACPPGKKLQNLLLLSGGERALTAIALLFAIRRVKPTPFCILDEIDAALDESNLGRFTQLMEEFAQDTQFLVITHRPRTMEAANTLYGVTMGEDAISQIISVALD